MASSSSPELSGSPSITFDLFTALWEKSEAKLQGFRNIAVVGLALFGIGFLLTLRSADVTIEVWRGRPVRPLVEAREPPRLGDMTSGLGIL